MLVVFVTTFPTNKALQDNNERTVRLESYIKNLELEKDEYENTFAYNDDNPTCTACIGIAHQYELLQLNSEISTTQNRENALEKSINEQTGLKTTIINRFQEDEPKSQSKIQQQSTPKQNT